MAIPATLAYNLLVRTNKQTLAELGKFAFELHDLLVIGARATPRASRHSAPCPRPARSTCNGRALQDDMDDDGGFNPEINTTPLVDVMLVLLVIFIITVPAIQHSVKIDLPHAAAQQDNKPPVAVDLALDNVGHLHWDDRDISDSELPALIAEAAARSRCPNCTCAPSVTPRTRKSCK